MFHSLIQVSGLRGRFLVNGTDRFAHVNGKLNNQGVPQIWFRESHDLVPREEEREPWEKVEDIGHRLQRRS